MQRASMLVVNVCLIALIALGAAPAHHPTKTPGAELHRPLPSGDAIAQPADAPPVSRADASMQKLIDGNDRFRHDESTFPRLGLARRSQTFTDGQAPFAAILACADSRVPVEAIFDQGVGDLFVVRVAGNVADTAEIGTLEYGVGHLNIPLIVVLGHTRCGAVTAAADGVKGQGHVAKLIDNIIPAVDQVKQREPEARGQRLVRLATRANVMQSIQDILRRSPEIAAAVKADRVRVVGGVYDIQTGAIEWLGPHPRQSELTSTAPVPHSPHASDGEKPHPGGDARVRGEPEHKPHHARSKPTTQQSKAAPRRENWIALGGLLGVSTLASGVTIHLLYGRGI